MKKFFCVAIGVAMLSGCASMATTNAQLTQRTADALGLAPTQFKISNKHNDGLLRLDYLATTNEGNVYSCYLTGAFSISGSNVSDAICHPRGETNEPAPSNQNSNGTCNALLAAANKC